MAAIEDFEGKKIDKLELNIKKENRKNQV